MKPVIDKIRARFTVALENSLIELKDITLGLNHTVHEIKDAQLKINHEHTNLLKETHDNVKNSGSLVLSKDEMVSKIFSGAKLYLDPRDIAVVPHLALDGIWEHRITAAWLSVVQSHDTVFDIGANFGYFGILAAQNTDKKHSQVHFFEANPNLIPYIKKSLSVNWLNEQSVIANYAVADKKGTLTLHVLKDYIGSSSVYDAKHVDSYMHGKMEAEEAEAIKVPAISIDEYSVAHDVKQVDLIKMDIEGYEDKAYAGMRDLIQRSPRATLFIEFTRESYEHPEKFYQQLLKDFGNVYLIDEDGRLVKQKKTSYDDVIGNPDDWVMPVFSKRADLAT